MGDVSCVVMRSCERTGNPVWRIKCKSTPPKGKSVALFVFSSIILFFINLNH